MNGIWNPGWRIRNLLNVACKSIPFLFVEKHLSFRIFFPLSFLLYDIKQGVKKFFLDWSRHYRGFPIETFDSPGSPRKMSQFKYYDIQWNPVNTTTFGPWKFGLLFGLQKSGSNNRVVVWRGYTVSWTCKLWFKANKNTCKRKVSCALGPVRAEVLSFDTGSNFDTSAHMLWS